MSNMSLPREWNFQDSWGSLHRSDGAPKKQEMFDSELATHSISSFRIPDIDEIPITIPTIRSLLAECNVGSLHSIVSAPPAPLDNNNYAENVSVLSVPIDSPKRPISLMLDEARDLPEIPLVKTNALHYPPPSSEIDEDDNENLLTVSSVTARPLIAKSREIQRKKKKKAKQQKLQECPDGGYGWVIVFGASSVLFWVTGLVKSYGVLYVEIMETFQGKASLASWIPAILSALCLALAPISSALCEKYSCRRVVFFGGLFCAMGLMLSYFATKLWHLLITFGVLTGIGGGLSTTPGIILVSRYFDKRRALANGLCISGAAVGSFVFPILIEYLVKSYGFHGTLLVLGSCMLHVCMASMLYRPPPDFTLLTLKASSETNLSSNRYVTIEENVESKKSLDWIFNRNVVNNEPPVVVKEERPAPILQPQSSIDSEEDDDKVLDSINLREIPMRSSGILHSVEDLSIDSSFYFRNRSSFSSNRGSSRRHRASVQPRASNDEIVIKIPIIETTDNSLTVNSNRGLSKSMVITNPNATSVAGFIKQENKASQRSILGKIKKYIDLGLLKECNFILFCMSTVLMTTGCPYAIIYLPSYIIDIGYTKHDAGFLLGLCACHDLFGRLFFGYLSDLQLFDRRKAYITFIFGAGIAVMLIPSVNEWYLICMAVGCYGLFFGCWYLLIPTLLADIFGTERISSSIGLVRMFQSIMAITVPPTAGLLRDIYGSYEICFYTMGTFMVVGSLPLLVAIIRTHKDGSSDIAKEKN